MPTIPSLSFVCPIPWSEMRGDEKERFCSRCTRTVVNVSLLTEARRATLLAQSQPGQLCVAYYRRLSGELVSAENPLTETESRRVVQLGVAALTLGAAAFAINSLSSLGPAIEDAQQDVAESYQRAAAELAQQTRQMVQTISNLGGASSTPTAYVTMGVICVAPPPATSPTSVAFAAPSSP